MLNIRKILVPVVFAETSRNVLRRAAWLARRFGAEMILMHVVTPLSYPTGWMEIGDEITAKDWHSSVVQRAQRDLDGMIGPELDGIAVTTELVRGDPAREIVKMGSERDVDLIVMSTGGEGEIARSLLGSVTGKVLRETHCAVWTGVHLEDEAVPGQEYISKLSIGSVLCPVKLGAHSTHTITIANEVAETFGAKLTLVHVTASVEMYGPGGYYVDQTWKNEVVGGAAQEMARLQKELGNTAEVIIESGNVAEALDRAAVQTNADVLVVGRIPGRSHLGDNGEGYGIIRQSRIPVLST